MLWVVPFCFLCQPFSQVIIFIDWSEDTQYPEGPADDHFKFRRNSLLLLLFCCFVDFGLFPYVRSLFEHFPEQSLLLSFLLLSSLFSSLQPSCYLYFPLTASYSLSREECFFICFSRCHLLPLKDVLLDFPLHMVILTRRVQTRQSTSYLRKKVSK